MTSSQFAFAGMLHARQSEFPEISASDGGKTSGRTPQIFAQYHNVTILHDLTAQRNFVDFGNLKSRIALYGEKVTFQAGDIL